jgi:hypothetical protein
MSDFMKTEMQAQRTWLLWYKKLGRQATCTITISAEMKNKPPLDTEKNEVSLGTRDFPYIYS